MPAQGLAQRGVRSAFGAAKLPENDGDPLRGKTGVVCGFCGRLTCDRIKKEDFYKDQSGETVRQRVYDPALRLGW